MVLANNNELVLLPINEPTFGTKRKSQIQVSRHWTLLSRLSARDQQCWLVGSRCAEQLVHAVKQHSIAGA
jgi:hypothetical protein